MGDLSPDPSGGGFGPCRAAVRIRALCELLHAPQLLLCIDNELVVDGASLVDELLDGGRLPERVQDDAAPQGKIGTASACGDERSVCDVDVAEPVAVFLSGAYHDGGEDTSVEDGKDNVAPSCQQSCGIPTDEADFLVLAFGEAGQEIVGSGGKPQNAAPAVWMMVVVSPFVPISGTSARMSVAAGSFCMSSSRFFRFMFELLSVGGTVPPLLSAVGGTYGKHGSIDQRFLQTRETIKQSPVPFWMILYRKDVRL